MLTATLRYHDNGMRASALNHGLNRSAQDSREQEARNNFANLSVVTVADGDNAIQTMLDSFKDGIACPITITDYNGQPVTNGKFIFMSIREFMAGCMPTPSGRASSTLYPKMPAPEQHPLNTLAKWVYAVNKSITFMDTVINSVVTITVANSAVTDIEQFQPYYHLTWRSKPIEETMLSAHSTGIIRAGYHQYSIKEQRVVSCLATVNPAGEVGILTPPFAMQHHNNSRSIFTFSGKLVDKPGFSEVWCAVDAEWTNSFNEVVADTPVTEKTFVFFNYKTGKNPVNIQDSKKYTVHTSADGNLSFVTRKAAAIATARQVKETKNIKSGTDFMIQVLTLAAIQSERKYDGKEKTASGNILMFGIEPAKPVIRGTSDFIGQATDSPSDMVAAIQAASASVAKTNIRSVIKSYLRIAGSDQAPDTNVLYNAWCNSIRGVLPLRDMTSSYWPNDVSVYSRGNNSTPLPLWSYVGQYYASQFFNTSCRYTGESLVRLGTKLSFNMTKFYDATEMYYRSHSNKDTHDFCRLNVIYDLNLPAPDRCGRNDIKKATNTMMFGDLACISAEFSEALFQYVKVKTVPEMCSWYDKNKDTFHAAFDTWAANVDATYDNMPLADRTWLQHSGGSITRIMEDCPAEVFSTTIRMMRDSVDRFYADLKAAYESNLAEDEEKAKAAEAAETVAEAAGESEVK